jgi:hypothetical protein
VSLYVPVPLFVGMAVTVLALRMAAGHLGGTCWVRV